ncbi:MAG: hypothetical protein EA366_03195 [Spirulina sp. DLM2.Bin59]|nr:MAG: hypothetical protein EA366_03195 [Spirulina sp. DLM2.Bin59]
MFSFWVTLNTKQVHLRTELPEIAALILEGFAAMLGAEKQPVIAQFLILYENQKYHLINQDSGQTIKIIDDSGHCFIHLKYYVMTALIEANAQWLWFHAGAVANDDGAIILPAAAGGGKSTFTTYFAQQGWQYCSDDVVPLDFYAQQIYPVPQTPRPRAVTAAILSPEQLALVEKQAISLTPPQISDRPHGIQAIVFPYYQPDVETQLYPCSTGKSVIRLLENCINFPVHKRQAMPFLVKLMEAVHRFELVYSDRLVACDALWQLAQQNWQMEHAPVTPQPQAPI